MTVITATYRNVTPMFLGGADQKATSLRPPSVKGALRFWWRALSWGRCLWDARGQETEAIRRLHQQEAGLFGSAADEGGSGQGRFVLDVHYTGRPLEPGELPPASPDHQYLLGQGLYHFRRHYLRSALEPGELRLRVRFRPGTHREQQDSLVRALLALGLFGGLGGRGRRGFGSLAIQSLEGTDRQAPAHLNALETLLAELIGPRPDDPPPYTAFSAQSRIDAIPGAPGQEVWTLLGEIGADLQRYRSWGQNGKVANQPAERNFPDDHDLAREAALGKPVAAHPRRAVFGLPHNYFFSSLAAPHNKLEVNALAPQPGGGWSDIGTHRRASPLFIHFHEFPNGSRVALLALLPAQFLPAGWQIGLQSTGPVRRVGPDPDWTVLHRFMDRFANRCPLLKVLP